MDYATVFKDQLPKGLSWPLGLREVAGVLSALPVQIARTAAGEKTAVLFVFDSLLGRPAPAPTAAIFPRLSVIHYGVPSLRNRNGKLPDDFATYGRFLFIHPVPSTSRAAVREALVAHGSKLLTGGGWKIDVGYEPTSGVLRLMEHPYGPHVHITPRH